MKQDAVLSADDHLELRTYLPELFQYYLPEALKDRGPRVVDTPNGLAWVVDGQSLGPYIRGAANRSAITRAGLQDDGYRTVTPSRRLADMDTDSIWTSVIYGSPGLAIKSAALKAACLRAYNDWGADFNHAAPERLCVLPNLPSHSVEDAVREVQQIARSGHRGAVLNPFELPTPVFDAAWEPLWDAIEEAGLPVSFHIGGGTHSIQLIAGSWKYGAYTVVNPMQLDEPLVGMLFSGALERHPRLRLVLAESGLGWLPYIKERMDLESKTHGPTARDYRLSAKPSELFERQVYATFEEDVGGIALIPTIGVDNVMWASDYPHQDSTFPRSREALRDLFANTDPVTTQKVTGENCARLYKFKVG